MNLPTPCPRCNSQRLGVLYCDAEGDPVGGQYQCTDCGPRHAEALEFKKNGRRRDRLLERKAS